MSRQHEPLLLHRGALSGEVTAVRLASDGATITDKYPIGNWAEVEQEIRTGAEPAAAPQPDVDAAGVARWSTANWIVAADTVLPTHGIYLYPRTEQAPEVTDPHELIAALQAAIARIS